MVVFCHLLSVFESFVAYSTGVYFNGVSARRVVVRVLGAIMEGMAGRAFVYSERLHIMHGSQVDA